MWADLLPQTGHVVVEAHPGDGVEELLGRRPAEGDDDPNPPSRTRTRTRECVRAGGEPHTVRRADADVGGTVRPTGCVPPRPFRPRVSHGPGRSIDDVDEPEMTVQTHRPLVGSAHPQADRLVSRSGEGPARPGDEP